MNNRLKALIADLPKTSFGDLAQAKDVKQLFDRGHVHCHQVFDEINWWQYHIVDLKDVQHAVQLVFYEPGDKRNHVFCQTCQKSNCIAAIAAMLHFVSTQQPLSRVEVCHGCGQALH